MAHFAAEAITLCHGRRDVPAYAEDPGGPQDGHSGREITAEFRRHGRADRKQHVTTDWRQMGHAIQLHAMDIALAGPHFWTMQAQFELRKSVMIGDRPGARTLTVISIFRSQCLLTQLSYNGP